MTQQQLNGDIPDFSEPERQRLLFSVDGEIFEAAPALPARKAMECLAIAERWEQAEASQAEELLSELLSRVLLPESYERFAARLGDLERPITVQQLPRVIEHLFERYGMGPTRASSDASTGSENPAVGATSGGASPSPELISTASPSIGH